MKEGKNSIDVVYDGTLTTKVEVVANAQGIPVSAMPETTKRPEASIGSSIVSKDTAVTKIEKGAFKNCSKLFGTISLTKNIQAVGDSAFYGCKNIKKVVFGSKPFACKVKFHGIRT